MAAIEHTEDLNDVTVSSSKYAIVVTSDDKIAGKIIKGSTHIVTTDKVIVGTLNQINTYIENNSLEYYQVPIPNI